MTVFSTSIPKSRIASRKKVFSGLPTTSAFLSVAYSKPDTNGPDCDKWYVNL